MLRDLGCGLGYAGGTGLTTIGEVRDELAWADAAGFDSFWVSHIFGVDPLVALAAVADAGPNVAELGTSVMPFVGRHPIALAQQARTAQQACDGRLTLGIGPSHEIVVEAVYGERWAGPVQRTAEYLDALLPLCRGEAAAVSGEQIHAHASLNVPSTPVPVVLAALGPRMLELAGRLGIGTHLGNCGPRTIREHIVPTMQAASDEAGNGAIRAIALVGVCVTDDRDGALEHGRATSAGYAALPSYRAMLDREGVESGAELMCLGSIDEVVEGLAAYVDAGATDLRIGVVGPDEETRAATRAAIADALK